MGEGGGGEEKGRPDTNPFSKSCDTSKIWMWQAFLSFSSLPFSLPSFPFSPETPHTQAIEKETKVKLVGLCCANPPDNTNPMIG